MIRRLLDRLTHVELNVTDADIGAAGETVWVTGYRRRWPHCVALLMSYDEAELLGEMLRSTTDESACRTRKRMPRPEITVVDVLDHWNGTKAFLGSYLRQTFENGSHLYGMVYGCITEESERHQDSDDFRVYDLWDLPPREGVLWQIKEDELVYDLGAS